jgi:copper chaperone CopZ
MTCEHCVAAVTEELSALSGVHTVAATLSDGAVTIRSSRTVTDGELRAAVLEAGYGIAD